LTLSLKQEPKQKRSRTAKKITYKSRRNKRKFPRSIQPKRNSKTKSFSPSSDVSIAAASIHRDEHDKHDQRRTPMIGCRCKFSRCLKLYCECFQKKSICNEACNCRSCLNTTNDEPIRTDAMKAILARRPDAFKERVKMIGVGCSCKKNKCLKKY